MISLEMNTTSRSTANKWSLRPLIMTPSTNAAAGAFLISSLMPQAWRTMRRSKSRYFSKIARESSISLPELSTASAHLRNKGYRPPCPESSSLAISSCERCSKLPLGVDIDRNVILRAHPHFDHVGVRESYAAIGPVVRFIIRRRMVGRVGKPVNHDRAARGPALLMRAQLIHFVGIGDLDGQKVIAARVAPREEIASFGSFEVALALLLSYGAQSQRYSVDAQKMVAVVQIQLVLGLVDDHSIGESRFCSQGAAHTARTRRQHQTHEQTCRRITAESLNHCQKYTW